VSGAVVLLSGGLDSSTLLHAVARDLGAKGVVALTLCYGQKHAREIACAAAQARAAGVSRHRIADVAVLGALVAGASALTDPAVPVPDLAGLSAAQREQPSTYVPHRNLVFLSLAAAFAEAQGMHDVYYGAQRQDAYGYWDCTPAFADRLNAVLALNRREPVRVHAPFAELSKRDIVRLGLDLGVPYAETWSCYRGGDRPCGACPACVERGAAFRSLGVPDPLAA